MANLKFTFKKCIKTGRYRSFENDSIDIKVKGRVCGNIAELSHFSPNSGKYRIGFMVERQPTEQDPAPFKWVWIKKLFDTENEARSFVTEKGNDVIEQAKVNLYFREV